MELYKALKKGFRKELKKLNKNERVFLTVEKPFLTEDCALCGNSFHGTYDIVNEKWIKAESRDEVIQKVSGCENLEQLYAFLR